KFEWLSSKESSYAPGELKVDVEKAKLPDPDRFCLSPIILKLTTAKNRVHHIPAPAFARARSKSNPFELIHSSVFVNRSAVKLANIDHLTNRQLVKLDIDGGGAFAFVDLCAGPGGFTEYVLWRLANEGDVAGRVKGYGMTLRGAQDFAIEQFNPTSRRLSPAFTAFYGVDDTGDITRPSNITALVSLIHASHPRGVHLATADGAHSVAGDELHQEHHLRPLLVAQTLTAFRCLRPNGNFVCKLFDALDEVTVDVLHVLYRSFDRIAVIKPVSSRPANGERYVICMGFRSGDHKPVVEVLEETLKALNGLRVDAGMGRTVSSHTEPPPGFMTLEERVELGLMDVVRFVAEGVVEGDEAFKDYVQGSNMKNAIKQADALKLLESLVAEDAVSPFDQEEAKFRCLREWGLPV
ncbi:FtsJ methyltransferase domain-containing protein 2, partial [Irineochytrium annulatum]